MRRTRSRRLLAFALLLGLLAPPRAAWADPGPEGGPASTDPNEPDGLCSARQQRSFMPGCPDFGPGWIDRKLIELRLPYPLPPLEILPLQSNKPIVPFVYSRVTTPNAQVYTSPAEALIGAPPVRDLGDGFVFVSLDRAVELNGEPFVQINRNEYVRGGDLASVKPSGFQGVYLAEAPQYPFAWVLTTFYPRLTPGGEVNPAARALLRYDMVQIFGKLHVGEYDWYMIGPDQWIEQRAVAKVEANPPPPGVSGRWIQINLFEQTLAAYEGERMVYATLVSSGLRKFPTRPGLFQIWVMLEVTKMSGAYLPDKSDYYFLEDVPWVMYFDGQRALHGAYWHDSFGYKKSHGCVNLAPRDAQWLYRWASTGVWVWVYDPSGQTPTEGVFGGGP